MTRYIPILCAALLLSGCGATLFGPEPGLSELNVTAPDGLAIEFNSGKEYGSIEGRYVKPDGTEMSFTASQVEAFEGQMILLEMQAQQLEAASSLTALLNRLVELYMSGGVPTGPTPTPPAP